MHVIRSDMTASTRQLYATQACKTQDSAKARLRAGLYINKAKKNKTQLLLCLERKDQRLKKELGCPLPLRLAAHSKIKTFDSKKAAYLQPHGT